MRKVYLPVLPERHSRLQTRLAGHSNHHGEQGEKGNHETQRTPAVMLPNE
jgi:hypothetical protein